MQLGSCSQLSVAFAYVSDSQTATITAGGAAMRVFEQGLLALAAAGGLGLVYKVDRSDWMPCQMPPGPPPLAVLAAAAAACPSTGRLPAPIQLCATDRQLTLNVVNELLGLLGAWLRGEQYHGQHHLRGASSSLRPVGEGLADLIGNTPLIRLASLSEQTGCQVRRAMGQALLMQPSDAAAAGLQGLIAWRLLLHHTTAFAMRILVPKKLICPSQTYLPIPTAPCRSWPKRSS